jgi:hypothetical protein
MSQPTHITDEPLPDADPVLPKETASTQDAETHDQSNKLHLENPDMAHASSYGRTDPASLAAVQSHELSDPSLEAAAATELAAPELTVFKPGEGIQVPVADVESRPEKPLPASDFSNWDPHLAHLAQVGLTSADHWDEQIKPRIDQLHEDITQVNEQLDDLEKAKPKPKKS